MSSARSKQRARWRSGYTLSALDGLLDESGSGTLRPQDLSPAPTGASHGAITAEIVFNWPGLGLLTVQALDARDYPLLQGIFLLIAVSVVFANFAADIVYGYLDPRVRV